MRMSEDISLICSYSSFCDNFLFAFLALSRLFNFTLSLSLFLQFLFACLCVGFCISLSLSRSSLIRVCVCLNICLKICFCKNYGLLFFRNRAQEKELSFIIWLSCILHFVDKGVHATVVMSQVLLFALFYGRKNKRSS